MKFGCFTRVLKGAAIYILSVTPVVLAVDHAIVCVAHVQGKSMAPTLNASPASPNGPTTYTSGPNPNRSGTNTGVSDPRDLLHGLVGIRPETPDYPDNGELIVVRKVMYQPARGDVVVLDSPERPGEQSVKRLVAMEGDVIIFLSPIRNKSIPTLSREIEKRREVKEGMEEQREMEELFGSRLREAEDVRAVIEEVHQHFERREERERRKAWYGLQETRRGDGDHPVITHEEKDYTSTINNKSTNSTTNNTYKPEDKEPPEKTDGITANKDNKTENNEQQTKDDNMKVNKILFEDVELLVVRIPQGHCWVEGDNAEVSRDSKEYGPIPLALVRGKVEGVIWPPSLAGFIRPFYQGTTRIMYTNRMGPRGAW